MGGKSRGNFIVISGMLIAVLLVLVSLGVWKLVTPEAEASKPVIYTGTGVPKIIGPERKIESVESDVAKNVAENSALVAVEDPELAPIPEAVSQSSETGRWIYIDKMNYRLYLVNGKSVENSWGIAVGKRAGQKQKVGDMTTPEGTFPIQQIQDARTWNHDFKDGKGVIKGAYGPWFIRLKTVTKQNGRDRVWTGIGIHGTHDPDSIGTMATEGCIRMRNEDVSALKELVSVGLKVVIGSNAE